MESLKEKGYNLRENKIGTEDKTSRGTKRSRVVSHQSILSLLLFIVKNLIPYRILQKQDHGELTFKPTHILKYSVE